MKPLAIDLYCGLGGWAEGFLAEGYRVIGFDLEAHDYGTGGYPGELVLRDVRSISGVELIREYGIPAVIVGSSPCQEFSYRAMPWTRAKALPPPRLGIDLFQAQFRIQREASAAAARYIPLVAENVRGAQKWVGRARWHFGSYYLWGDVPALMPITAHIKRPGRNFHFPEKFGIPSPSFHGDESEPAVDAALKAAIGQKEFVKVAGNDWNDFRRIGKVSPHWRMQLLEQRAEASKGNGSWFGNYREAKEAGRGSPNRYTSSNSLARKKASALIAKIPFPLAQHIARVFKPDSHEQTEQLGSGPIPSGQSSETDCGDANL